MENNNELFVKRIAEKLEKLGVSNYSCPICNGTEFSVQSSVAAISVSEDKDKIDLKSFVPSVMLICTKCGHIDFFAYSILENK